MEILAVKNFTSNQVLENNGEILFGDLIINNPEGALQVGGYIQKNLLIQCVQYPLCIHVYIHTQSLL